MITTVLCIEHGQINLRSPTSTWPSGGPSWSFFLLDEPERPADRAPRDEGEADEPDGVLEFRTDLDQHPRLSLPRWRWRRSLG